MTPTEKASAIVRKLEAEANAEARKFAARTGQERCTDYEYGYFVESVKTRLAEIFTPINPSEE